MVRLFDKLTAQRERFCNHKYCPNYTNLPYFVGYKSMSQQNNSLRAAAVKQLQHASTTNSEAHSAEELLYELQVHQIELEMQNENLRQSNEALAEWQQEYFNLYEFAPIGYLTLSQQGLIEKINLTGATLLGEKFPQLLQRRFAGFINATDTDRWHLFFAQVMRGNEQKTLEVSLKQPNGNGVYAQLNCLPVLKANKQPTLWIALTDITEIKQIAAELVIANVELAFQNTEKENRAAELVIANVELTFENTEKENRAAELVIANVELAFQNKEKEARVVELDIANIELFFQQKEKEKHRKIENALQKSEEKLKFLLSNAPVTIFICEATPPFRLTYISPNISGILGYLPKQFLENCSPEQFLENCSPQQFLENCNFWEENIHPDDVAQLYKHLSQFPKNGTFQHEFRFRTADGSYRWMYDELRLMRDEAGEANQIIGFWVDITERKQAEKWLKESEERLQIAKLSASIGIWDYDIVADIVNWDDRMREIWEFSAEKTIHYADWINNLHPDDRLPAQNAIDKALMPTGNGYFHVEYRVIAHCTQQEHWIMATGQTFFVQKQPTRMIGTVQDITERKRLEKQLTKSERHLRAILDTISECVKLITRDGTLLSMNPSGLAMIDADSEDVVRNQCVYSLIAPEYRDAFQAFNEAVCDGKSGKMEFEMIGLKNTRHWMESHAVPFSLENGETVQLAVTQEITQRKQAEQQIIESHTLLRTIIDTAPVRIFWKDTNLCFVGGNMNFAKDAGMSCPEELIGKDDYQMAWANQAELYRSDDRAVIKSGISKLSYVEPITIMNGVEQWVSTSKVPLKNQHNEVIGLLGIYEDITERKHAEMALRIAATIFESQAVGMMIADASTHIIKVNQAFTRLTGYSEAELLNQKPRLFHSGRQDRQFYDNLWQSIRDSGGWQGEIWNKRKNGDIYPELYYCRRSEPRPDYPLCGNKR